MRQPETGEPVLTFSHGSHNTPTRELCYTIPVSASMCVSLPRSFRRPPLKPMADQFDHLRKAAQLLAGDCDLRQAVPIACGEFWAAMFDPDEWPTELLDKANLIVEQILRHGPIRETLPRLDAAAIRKIAEDIKQLAAEVEKTRNKLPPSA